MRFTTSVATVIFATSVIVPAFAIPLPVNTRFLVKRESTTTDNSDSHEYPPVKIKPVSYIPISSSLFDRHNYNEHPGGKGLYHTMETVPRKDDTYWPVVPPGAIARRAADGQEDKQDIDPIYNSPPIINPDQVANDHPGGQDGGHQHHKHAMHHVPQGSNIQNGTQEQSGDGHSHSGGSHGSSEGEEQPIIRPVNPNWIQGPGTRPQTVEVYNSE